jgi:hypothetical protein
METPISTAIANSFETEWLESWRETELVELVGFISKLTASGELPHDDAGAARVTADAQRIVDRHRSIAAAVSRFDDDGNLLDPTGNEAPWNRSGY